jgi:hypothetical protein
MDLANPTSSIMQQIKAALDAGRPLGQIAQMLGVSEGMLGTAVKTLGGVYATKVAGDQATATQNFARQFMDFGAEYRKRLSDSYGDLNAYYSSPDVQAAVKQGTDATARALSTKGNPAQSGNALQEMQDYASNMLFGKLGQERDRLAGFGGLTAYNQAVPQLATNAISSMSNVPNVVGAVTSDILNPRRTLAQEMFDYRQAGLA